MLIYDATRHAVQHQEADPRDASLSWWRLSKHGEKSGSCSAANVQRARPADAAADGRRACAWPLFPLDCIVQKLTLQNTADHLAKHLANTLQTTLQKTPQKTPCKTDKIASAVRLVMQTCPCEWQPGPRSTTSGLGEYDAADGEYGSLSFRRLNGRRKPLKSAFVLTFRRELSGMVDQIRTVHGGG